MPTLNPRLGLTFAKKDIDAYNALVAYCEATHQPLATVAMQILRSSALNLLDCANNIDGLGDNHAIMHRLTIEPFRVLTQSDIEGL